MNTEVLSVLIGQVMPIVVEAINTQLPDSSKVRYIAALTVSILLGLATTYVSGDFNTAELLGSFGLVFSSSQTAYRMWFKGSAIEAKFKKN